MVGLILAAGEGRRFGGRGKLLAELDGRPLLEYAVRAQCAVPELGRVLVVLGARAEQLRELVEFGRAQTVVCEEWAQGQSASLQRGLRELGETSRVIVTLGDQPFITPEVIRRFIDAPDGSRATYGGRPAHPVVLGPAQLRAARALRGDFGARALLDGPLIECGDLSTGVDIDTREDLEAVQREARAVL